jgi:hypothetical protein
MRRAPKIILAFLVALGGAVVACAKDQPSCFPDEYQGCYCADGGLGYQACAASQDGYAACVCDGTTPGLDAGPPPREAGTGDGGGRPDASDGGHDASDADAADAEDG